MALDTANAVTCQPRPGRYVYRTAMQESCEPRQGRYVHRIKATQRPHFGKPMPPKFAQRKRNQQHSAPFFLYFYHMLPFSTIFRFAPTSFLAKFQADAPARHGPIDPIPISPDLTQIPPASAGGVSIST
jgi:hypothetical protein